MKFEPTYESVSQHKIPKWYDDAKFGIFVHWSLFSVPAYAHHDGRTIMEIAEAKDLHYQMQNNPYAEWYLNTLRIDGSHTQAYHEKKYGKDYSYFNFQKEFEDRSKNVNFDEWADLFRASGAKYSVLVTKHHDGYCLWPSKYKNPFDASYQSSRDLVGEWTQAMRAKGLKAGLYYSGIFDWTFKKCPIDSDVHMLDHLTASPEYAQYATNHMYELIERYQPSVLWNDIGYPAGIDLNKLFADYYNTVPEGVIDDRWNQTEAPYGMTEEELRKYIDELRAQGREFFSLDPNSHASKFHCDYVTPEYQDTPDIQTKKFELTRGIGFSFGYNQEESEKDMMNSEKMLYTLMDVVSKNGNMLLNVGPMADGTIPEMQKKPLLELGAWLKANGEAVYGTRAWTKATAETADGKAVRFTSKPDTLYATILDKNVGDEVVIKDLTVHDNASVSLVGCGCKLSFENCGNNLKVRLPAQRPSQLAYTICIK